MTDALNFQLRPSVAKWIVRSLVLLSLGGLLWGSIHLLWIVLLLSIVLIATYILELKNQIIDFAHLDQEVWTVSFSRYGLRQLRFQHALNYGYFIFIKFYDDLNKKTQYICIAKDQLDFDRWKILKKFINLH